MLEENPLNSALAMLSTSMFVTAIASLSASLVVYGLYKVLTFIYGELTSPLRAFPGPPSPSFIFGHLRELRESTSSIFTADLKALNYVLFNSYDFHKPDPATYNIRRVLGNGILLVEGDLHRNQRRILNPAFGPQQIRELTELFVEKAAQLRDLWSAEVVKQKGVARLDGMSWLTRAVLDVIGLAGFNYNFNALMGDSNSPFATVVALATKHNLLSVLKAIFPIFRILPTISDSKYKIQAAEVNTVVDQLVSDSKAAVVADKQDSKTWNRRDLLSLLIRANTMLDLPANKRMNDADVVAQIFTFILAGHETTSVSTTWALYALTQNKEAQMKLREEIYTIATDNPTLDDLNSLPYLDRVIRETLRLYPFTPFTMRESMRDSAIPLSKPFTDAKGIVHSEIRINKGQTVLLPIAVVNRSKALWGEDALEFKPERWEKVPEAVTAVPGIWGNILTFSGGPRACIGYRFALIEMKALLFTLVRGFELDLAVPGKDIGKTRTAIRRPIILTDPSEESAVQLPLVIRPVFI